MLAGVGVWATSAGDARYGRYQIDGRRHQPDTQALEEIQIDTSSVMSAKTFSTGSPGLLACDLLADANRTSMNLKCTNRGHNREEDKMHKRYEEEQWRIEHADNATITFTIALHGPHAWEMQMEDSHRYHGISHGWATENPHDWENTIAPVLRQFFVKS